MADDSDVPASEPDAEPDADLQAAPGTPAAPGRGWARSWLTRRRIIQAVLVLGLAYVVVPLVSELPDVLGALRAARPAWLIVAALATTGGFISVSVALRACAGIPIPYRDGVQMQVASTFTGTATPASVGSLALAVQFLIAHGLPASIAAAVVGLQNLIQALVHVVFLVVLAVVGGRSVDVLKDAPSGWTVLVILGVALAVVGVALGVRRIRAALAELWRHRGRPGAEHFAALVRSPRRVTASVLGAAGGTLSSAVTLWAVLVAVDAGSRPVTAAFATMVGATFASAAPTPGGIGAVEAALVASLTALGITPGTALAATFGYRIIATWIPTGVGWYFYNSLQRRGKI